MSGALDFAAPYWVLPDDVQGAEERTHKHLNALRTDVCTPNLSTPPPRPPPRSIGEGELNLASIVLHPAPCPQREARYFAWAAALSRVCLRISQYEDIWHSAAPFQGKAVAVLL